jgi:hypothetical protein
MKLIFVTVILAVASVAQSGQVPDQSLSMPSSAEIGELLSKADQKVTGFEVAVKLAKPHLDEINLRLSSNYLDTASTAHMLIQSTQKNGASAYRLVGLLATLDDLSLDAANANVLLRQSDLEQLSKGKSPNVAALGSIVALSNSGAAVNDISELIMHATLRFVGAEEAVLEKVLAKMDSNAPEKK